MSRKILSLQKAALNPGFELLNKEQFVEKVCFFN